MYDVRDVGSYAIMLVVLPFFAVVFAVSMLIIAPLWLLARVAQSMQEVRHA